MSRPMRLASAVLSLALWAALGGCSLVVGSLSECSTDGDCASKGANLRCVDQLCVASGSSPVDAGGSDAGPPDAGPPDAGTPDAGPDPRCLKTLGSIESPNRVLLGAVLPKTKSDGSADQRGVLREHSVQLVVDKINNAGGLASGRPLAVRVCDDSSSSTLAQTFATALVAEGAVAIITPGSNETLAVAGAANGHGVLVVSGSASSVQIQSAGVDPGGGPKLVWSTAVSDDLQGKVLADLLYTALPDGGSTGYAKPSIIYRDDVYGQGLYTKLSGSLRANSDGGLTPGRHAFPSGDTDGGATLAAVQSAMGESPDAVVLIGAPDELDRALTDWTNPDPAWFFTDSSRATSLYTGMDGGLARLTGSRGTGPSTAPASSQVYADFSFDYTQTFGVDPTSVGFTANTFDATMLIAVGAAWADVHDGGITGSNIALAMGLLSYPDAGAPEPLEPNNLTTIVGKLNQGKAVNIQGASGELDFDPSTGVAPGPIDVWTVAPDGGLVTLQTQHP